MNKLLLLKKESKPIISKKVIIHPKKIIHIYGVSDFNSGDYLIGIATKKYFVEKYLNNESCNFVDFNCRQFINNKIINYINTFDYIIIGAGGLILPDTNPNLISCWQFSIDKQFYKKINKPIYVISIGFNLFYNQNINMSNKNNSIEDINRTNIFKDNIIELINVSKHFSLRHKQDIEELIKIVGEDYRSKISFEFCPTIWYSDKFWKNKISNNTMKYIVLEIKDDRIWRRYYNITKNVFYNELLKFVQYCINNKINVAYLSHDSSKDFYKFLITKQINIPFFDNSKLNENSIYSNYNKIKSIICTAGHSQMISHGLGINIISLVSHPKLKYFCDDIDNKKYIEINKDKDIYNFLIKNI